MKAVRHNQERPRHYLARYRTVYRMLRYSQITVLTVRAAIRKSLPLVCLCTFYALGLIEKIFARVLGLPPPWRPREMASQVSNPRVSYASLTSQNIGTLRKLNSVLFPVKYSEKYYQDVLHPTVENFCQLSLSFTTCADASLITKQSITMIFLWATFAAD